MDLEVVGRHALFFDDDANASFVNSRDALVEWNSLFIDRYDVRHLLSGPLPPITRRRHLNRSSSSPPPHPDAALEFKLDQERYLDLPSPSEEPEQDTGNDPEQADAGGYHTVGFSYGNLDEFTEQKINDTERKNNDTEPVFQPAFPVPESLIQNLPPTEKLHQIIARTATFVSKHGGQSEIILRVKQGDNPTFGFLMPDHHLHAYFRFLVDHQELLAYDTDGKSLDEEKKADGGIDQTGGALSLLGSVYGYGEDEDGIIEDAPELGKLKSVEAVNAVSAVSAVSASVPHGSEQIESSGNIAGKNDIVSKSPCIPLKEKVNVIKHNRTVSTVSIVKGGAISGTKKGSDASGSVSTAANKSHAHAMPSTPKVELPILEPPPDQKKVVEKIVEFILKNGREFEAVLIEQNCKHGRFLFLMPSNQYHSYYLTVLQKAQESKLPGKGLVSEKHESVGHVADKKTAKEGDTASSGSGGHDLPFDYDRKEKFKMVVSKLKKDGHDPPSKASEPQSGVSLDTAAAILQAATRGIKNPGLEIFPKSSSGIGQGHSNEGGRDLSSGSLHTSQLQTSVQKEKISGEPRIPVPVAKAIAETAAHAAANEADSSEASLTREQKLKAERLKRAKMFAAMIKSGSAPVKSESLRGLSAEPPESGISSSGNEVVNLSAKEREGSSVPLEADISDKVEEFEKKLSFDECNERRSKRSYRARSKRHEGEEESDNDLEQEAEEEEDKRGHKHSRKKRRSHHSSEHSRDRHKQRRHSSSKDRDSRHHRKHASYDDEKHRHSRRRHKRNTSDDEHQPRKRNRHDSSSDDEHRISRRRYKHSDSSDDEHQHYRRRHKHDNSSEDEHQHHRRSGKHRKPEPEKEADLEEGEIYTKADQSKASEGDHANREASVDFSKSHQIGRAPSQPPRATEVSDDLRAKIRAMLMATL